MASPRAGLDPSLGSYRPKLKDRLHLLFVVSRPEDEGFFDPRADPMAIMDAIDTEAPGKITFEFLRPPTLPKLQERLTDSRLPSVDILHFDGHGKYDSHGRLAERSPRALGGSRAADLLQDAATAAHQGYLLFEAQHTAPPQSRLRSWETCYWAPHCPTPTGGVQAL
jgi:hypothetical protein